MADAPPPSEPPEPSGAAGDADGAPGGDERTPVEVRRGGKAGSARRRNPLPWYRRGGVWLWIVLGTAAGAWMLSIRAEDRLYAFDVQPGAPEASAYCDAVGEHGGFGLFSPSGIALGDPARLDAWLAEGTAAHAALVAVAPAELGGDATEAQAAFADVLAVRAGGGDLEATRAAWDAAADEHAVAVERLDAYAVQACDDTLVVWPAWA